jgi:predicted DCC family thiol-disulfide oxidoreductase YuxK
MDKDKKDLFRFVPLQSEEGEEVGKTYNVSGIGKDTVVLIKNDQVYFRSAAVFRIFRMLGGWWKIPGIAGYIIPSFIADYFYNVVARNRYKWFGVIDI